ncbi:hypothetical protein BLA29_012630 [Euroglyphus maynei]|uniref:Uncharacterized protein n=1 Tax=Euroglyphus maynei TaxID=6958 RepID=A0A1Y3B8T6_EURMA|nr:hypothetical protein BLA29_012630 [Euroglyphus maynei]
MYGHVHHHHHRMYGHYFRKLPIKIIMYLPVLYNVKHVFF